MQSKKILIVDDDPEVCRSMQIRLQAHHYATFSAGDGITCMSEARKVKPDLILLDLGLPAGDGLKVLGWLRDIPALATIPVIVVSGRDRRSNYKGAFALGAREYLEKPFNNAQLLSSIRRALGELSKTEEPMVYNLVDPYPEKDREEATRNSQH